MMILHTVIIVWWCARISSGSAIPSSPLSDYDVLSLKSLVEELIDKQRENSEYMQEMKETVASQEKTITTLMGEVAHLQSVRADTQAKLSNVQVQLDAVAELDFTVDDIKQKQNKMHIELKEIQQRPMEIDARMKSVEEGIEKEFHRIVKNSDNIDNMEADVKKLKQVSRRQTAEIDSLKLKITDETSPTSSQVTENFEEIPIELGSGSVDDLLPQGKKTTSNSKSDNSIIDSIQKKFLDQELEVAKLQTSLSNVTVLVMQLQSKLMQTHSKIMDGGIDSMQRMFLNVTQQILSLQQWHLSNSGHVNGTELNRRQIESLMRATAHVQEKMDNLEAAVDIDRNVVSSKVKNLESNVKKLNKTTESVLRDLRRHSNLALQIQDSFNNDYKTLESRVFTVDNRLAHVEVKVLNASLLECKKVIKDIDQDKKMGKISYENTLLDGRIRRLAREMRDQNRNVDRVRNNTHKMGNTLGMLISLTRNLSLHLPDVIDTKVELTKFVQHLPTDCGDVLRSTGIRQNGPQLIHPDGSTHSVETYCEMTENDTWTYIQRRADGTTNFAKDWVEYKFGFGNPAHEFWIGNEYLHRLTAQDDYTLQIEMWDINNIYKIANYESFTIDNEQNGFRLNVSGYHGNATDALSYSNNMQFSTLDRDNDASSTHCGKHYTSGWWYKHCHYSNLNGRFEKGIVWFNYDKEEWVELKKSTMKIKLRNL